MPELPTGIVTFLFTDIEGSTRLLRDLGRDTYARVQDEHAAIVRSAIADANGVEIRTEGDAFFAVFATPIAGVRAAATAQRLLNAHAWPDGGVIRVRIGLHTGEGIRGGGDYVGIDVNRAARIAAAGHGGQVVLSEATTGLVADAVPDGVRLRDLGRHRLKDFARPERLHDLEIDGLPADFPPLRSETWRSSLPTPRTSFVGRQREIAEVAAILASARLVTLTGPGGTGKTRLALGVAADEADRFTDGVFFVDLSAVTDASVVASAVAGVLRVREAHGESLVDAVRRDLRDRRVLLVLDNLEQLLEAGPIVSGLLDAGPAVTILATSRAPLRLTGEHEYRLDPLPLPDANGVGDVHALEACESVRLFVERAAAVRPGFRVTNGTAPAIKEIVVRLDGLPLALELAASRLRVLSPAAVAERMGQRLPLLTGGPRDAPERQQTLDGAIRWSYELLERLERGLFARLSVFSGGWSVDAAEAICGSDLDVLEGLSTLVENSLVRQTDLADGTLRFAMLETIREFAQQQLETQGPGDRDDVERRHAQFFCDMAEEAEPHLVGEEQTKWLDALERERDNLRAALDRAERSNRVDEVESGLRTAAAIWRFWQARGHLTEGRERLRRLLAQPAALSPSAARARALGALGSIEYWLADYEPMVASYGEALEIARKVGDPALLAGALLNISFVPVVTGGDLRVGVEALHEALDVAGENETLLRAQIWRSLGWHGLITGNASNAVESLERGVALLRRAGERLALCESLVTLAGVALTAGDLEAARAHLNEATAIGVEAPPLVFAGVLLPHAVLANVEGRHRRAARLIGALAALADDFEVEYPEVAMSPFGDPNAEARAALGDEEFERAYEEGYEMTFDQIVAIVSGGETSP